MSSPLVKYMNLAQIHARRRIKRAVRRNYLELVIRAHAISERRQLLEARREFETEYHQEKFPLITVAIGTYNRGPLLVERTLPAVLAQTYGKIEVIVVGDGCTDDTSDRIRTLGDERVRFLNLPERGKYPEDPVKRWCVAGAYPINRAYAEARGMWIAHCDDDVVWKTNHLETLLRSAISNDYELVYSRSQEEMSPGEWRGRGIARPKRLFLSFSSHSTWLLRTYLRFFEYSVHTWRIGMTTDTHMIYRMKFAGVRLGFADSVTVSEPLRLGNTQARVRGEDRV